jgi:diguanylate cyclase (GGDEF)-like protein
MPVLPRRYYMAVKRKTLVIDPSQLKTRDPEISSIDPMKLRLLEPVGDDIYRPFKGDYELLDIKADAFPTGKSESKTRKIGLGLISYGLDKPSEVVEIKAGAILTPEDMSHLINPRLMEMNEGKTLGDMIFKATQAVEDLGFVKPQVYLPDEDGGLSKVEISMRAGANITWTPLSNNEAIVLNSIKPDAGTIIFDPTNPGREKTSTPKEITETLTQGQKPLALMSFKLKDSQYGVLALAGDEALHEPSLKAAKQIIRGLAINHDRIMASRQSTIKGLENRQAYARYSDQLLRYAVEKEEPMSIIMGDVDGLKRMNTVYHHQAAQLQLDALGTLLAGELREINREKIRGKNPRLRGFSWAGTDEMVVVGLIGKQDAINVANRLRDKITSRRTAPEESLTPAEKELIEEMKSVDDIQSRKKTDKARQASFRTVSMGIASYPDDLPLEALTQMRDGQEITPETVTNMRKRLRSMADNILMELKGKSRARNKIAYTGNIRVQ